MNNAINLLSRDNYKAIKHMDKTQLIQYLQRVYQRGYEAGLNAAGKSENVTTGKTEGDGK